MKIAVITCHNVKNYGSVFQTYATQKYLEELGHEVFFIDYQRGDTADHEILDSRARQSARLYRNRILRILFKMALYPSIKKQIKVFNAFLRKYITLTEKTYYSNEELKKDCPLADLYISGSDQIWNTKINHRIEFPYFLDFVQGEIPCISLSTSFGGQSLTEDEKPTLIQLLKKYKAISVREKSGVEILKQLGINDSEALLDPTNLLDSEIWSKLEESVSHPDKYILVYHLRPDKKFDQYVANLAKEKRINTVHILLYYHKAIVLNGKHSIVPTPGQVLTLIRNATYIVTDSFHMCSFSIKYHKPFVVMYPDNFGERIDNLLHITGLEKRHITNAENLTIIDEQIDYDKVDRIMMEQVDTMKNWINRVLDMNQSD